MERASFSNRDQTGVASTGWVIWAVKNSVSSSSILTASFVSASVAQTSAAGPPVGWLCYRWTLTHQNVHWHSDLVCNVAYLLDFYVFLFFRKSRRWPSKANTPSPTTLRPERFWSGATAASAAASDPAASRQRWAGKLCTHCWFFHSVYTSFDTHSQKTTPCSSSFFFFSTLLSGGS